jgi:hypothetical protein
VKEYPYKLLGVQPVYSSADDKASIEARLLKMKCSRGCAGKELMFSRIDTSYARQDGRKINTVAIVAQCQKCGDSSGALPHSAFRNSNEFPLMFELGSRLYNTLNQKPSGGLEPFELGKTYAGARDPSGAAARYAEWRCSRRYGGARLPAARVPSD